MTVYFKECVDVAPYTITRKLDGAVKIGTFNVEQSSSGDESLYDLVVRVGGVEIDRYKDLEHTPDPDYFEPGLSVEPETVYEPIDAIRFLMACYDLPKSMEPAISSYLEELHSQAAKYPDPDYTPTEDSLYLAAD